MGKIISAVEARNNLGSLIDDANRYNARFIIKKRNTPSVVLINYKDYLNAVIKKDPIQIALQKDAKISGASTLTARAIEKEIFKARNYVKSSS